LRRRSRTTCYIAEVKGVNHKLQYLHSKSKLFLKVAASAVLKRLHLCLAPLFDSHNSCMKLATSQYFIDFIFKCQRVPNKKTLNIFTELLSCITTLSLALSATRQRTVATTKNKNYFFNFYNITFELTGRFIQSRAKRRGV